MADSKWENKATAEYREDEAGAPNYASDNSIAEGDAIKITKTSSVLTVMVSGIALFSDGYNAQISKLECSNWTEKIVGYMEPLFSDLYGKAISSSIKTRLSNSYLIGEIFGMLAFGSIIDRLGRRTGIVFATIFLILGIILAAASHGKSDLG
jgi:MFS family permease